MTRRWPRSRRTSRCERGAARACPTCGCRCWGWRPGPVGWRRAWLPLGGRRPAGASLVAARGAGRPAAPAGRARCSPCLRGAAGLRRRRWPVRCCARSRSPPTRSPPWPDERAVATARHQRSLRPAGGGRPVRRPGAAARPGAPGHRARARPTSWPRRCWCSPTATGWTPGWAARCGRPAGCRRRDEPDWRRWSPPAASPELLGRPGRVVARRRGGARPRSATSVADRPPSQRALVPALVDGDDAGARPGLADDFRTTGLTHLLAVSGTNLTLVVGFLLVLARWCGVRGRWLYVVGRRRGSSASCCWRAPSRAWCGRRRWARSRLLAMGTDGRERGARALGAAVVALLLVDPWLATSVGFALSVVATAGHPAARARAGATPWRAGCPAGWRRRSRCRRPPSSPARRWSRRSRARSAWSPSSPTWRSPPAVGPATVLGLAGGLVGLVLAVGRPAARHARVAVRGLDRRGRPSRRRPADGGGRLGHRRRRRWRVLTVLAVGVALAGPRLLRRPAGGVGVLLPAGRRRAGPPADARAGRPTGWVLVACDVGPGRRAGACAPARAPAVVVDAGPDPAAVDAACDRLDITRGAAARAHPLPRRPRRRAGRGARRPRGRRGRGDPAGRPARGCRAGRRARAARTGWGPRRRRTPEARRVGDVTLQVLWPPPGSPTRGPGDGSTANDASVVLLVEVARRAAAADRRRRARGPGGAGPGLAGAAGRRAEGAAPRLAATRTWRSCPASARGWRWSAWGRTTTTATPRRETLTALAGSGRRGAAHRPGRRPGRGRGRTASSLP